MSSDFSKGFRIRCVPLADGLALLGAQGDWIQPAVDATATAHLAYKLASLADELAACHLFETPLAESLIPLKNESLWTVVTTRLAIAEAERRQDGRSADRSALLLDLWLVPALGVILGRVRQGSSAMYRRLLQVPGIAEYGYVPDKAVPSQVTLREYEARKSHWDLVATSGRACPVAMQWVPGSLELPKVAKAIESVSTRATRLAKIRAVRRFCEQAQATAQLDLPADKWASKAKELLANPRSKLAASFEAERNVLLSGLLTASDLGRTAQLPLWRHAQKAF